MTLYELLGPTGRADGEGRRLHGVVVGIVTNNRDPEGLGRVKVRFPWLSDDDESQWARIAFPMAGKGRGTYFLPEVDDEVLIAFGHGDPRLPYVVGALWNGQDAPPEGNADGENNVRTIRSRSGHELRFDDSGAAPKVELRDKAGDSIVLDAADDSIYIRGGKEILVSAETGAIRLRAPSVEIEAATDVKIEAGATLTLKGAMVRIN